MNPLLLNFVIALWFTSISTLLIGIFVYFKDVRNSINRTFAFYSFSIAWWSFCQIWLIASDERLTALIWTRVEQVGVFFIPTFFLHFTITFLHIKTKRWLMRIAYLFSFIFASLCPTRFMIANATPKFFVKYFATPGFAYHFAVTFFLICVIYCLSLLYGEYKRSTGARRNQISYLLWPSLFGYTGGAANFFLVYDINIFPLNPFGTYFVGLYALTVAYAVVAHRLMDINVVITRGVAYATLTAIIAGAYIGMMVGVDRIFAGVVGYNPTLVHSFLFIVVLFALIYVLPQMKIRAIELTRKTLFRGKYDYQQELSEATRVIPTLLNLELLGDYVLTMIRDTMLVNKLSFFVYDEAKHIYRALSSFGLNKAEVSKIKIGENSALAGLLRYASKPLVKDELQRTGAVPEEATGLAVKQLDSLGAELCIPLILKDDLAGILTLSNKKTGEMYTDEDLSLLAALANQVALAIEYIKAIDKISTEKRYVGLGKAAMRMAHDIKNPLVPLKTFLQILPDKYPQEFSKMSQIDAEFTGRFYESALEGVDRINLLIERALHYSRHPQPAFSEVELASLLDDVLTQEAVDIQKAKVELEKQYSSSDNKIKADGEQLMELFSNLISNGIDAMEGAPAKRLTVKAQPLSGRVAVEIIDTGCGIPKDKIDTIFDPFITYKHQGSGLGLAIAKKIVDDHKGTIEVNSEPGKGTTFKVILPKDSKKE